MVDGRHGAEGVVTSAPLLASVAAAAATIVAARPPAPPRRVRSLVGLRFDSTSAGRSGCGPARRVVRLISSVDRWLGAGGRWCRTRIGRPSDEHLDRRLGRSISIGALVGLLSPVAGVTVAVSGWTISWARARATRQRHADRLVREVPDLIELFRLANSAGLTVHLAVAAVAARSPGVLGASLRDVCARVAVGDRLADALDGFATCGEPARPLGAALAAGERYGDPLGPTLERLSLEARMLRRRHAEEAARRLPVHLLFPLVLCVLPAFVLLTVAPLLLVALPQLPH
jgi:tight adherence protein C